MSFIGKLPVLLMIGLAFLLFAASANIALHSNDSILVIGTVLAVAGLLMLSVPHSPRVPTTAVVRRRRTRVRKAAALERLIHEARAGEALSPQRPAQHHAA